MLVLNLINKSSWEKGPWLHEADKVQSQDEHTGYVCLAKRNFKMGFWCGYVGIPEGHFLYGIEYNHMIYQGLDIYIHGGITFSGFCDEENPIEGICHVNENNQRIWWLGFDCGHDGDYIPHGTETQYHLSKHLMLPYVTYKDLEYVKRECKELTRQLKAIHDNSKSKSFSR